MNEDNFRNKFWDRVEFKSDSIKVINYHRVSVQQNVGLLYWIFIVTVHDYIYITFANVGEIQIELKMLFIDLAEQ